ncbi:MAG TPA: ATPase, T2SS/T4P/T4SS family [Polyangia bacterium]|nr:ATPase, T2SS/T4P/T4SS family [Polyangia bacterium]
MFAITINEKGGETRRQVFDKPEITIGRVQGNDIILPKGNVSKRHSRIVFKDGKFIIVDLKSTNGTYVNGRKITSPLVIKGTDKVYIGDFILSVEDPTQGSEATPELAGGAPPLPPPQRSTFPPPPPQGRKTEGGPAELAEGDDLGVNEGPPELPALDKAIPASPFGDEDAPSVPQREPDALPEEGLALEGAPLPEPMPPRPTVRPPVARPSVPTRSSSFGGDPPPVRSDPPSAVPGEPVARVPSEPMARTATPADGVGPGPRTPSAPLPPRVTVRSEAPPPSGPTPSRGTPLPPRQSGSGLIPLPPTRPPVLPVVSGAQEPTDRHADEGRDRPLTPLRALANRLAVRVDMTMDPREAERQALDLVEAYGPDDGLPQNLDRGLVARDLVAEIFAAGPFTNLLTEPGVREVMATRYDAIFVDRGGTLILSERAFSSPEAFQRAIDRLVGERSVEPLIETRLADGTAVTVCMPPLASPGPVLLLRRPVIGLVPLSQLVTDGVLSQQMADLLTNAVNAKRTLLIAGPPGSGRTTLLAALAQIVATGERIVCIDDNGSLRLPQGCVTSLRAQGAMGDALAAAFRLRPDRLVLDDMRDRAAMAVLQATTALPGSMLAGAGLQPADALARLEVLVQLGPQPPEGKALHQAVATAIHLVVQLSPRAGGKPRVIQIAEVTGVTADGRIGLRELFQKRPDGSLAASGALPAFSSGSMSPTSRA